MSSLIFWAPYLTHKAIIGHKRDKKRQKNYERWEGLRDEYDDMKRVTTSQRQSLDYHQSQFDDPSAPQPPPRHSLSSDRDLFTLRDQQEAGDARTAWTPQERWQSRPLDPNPTRMSSASVERLPPNQHTSQAGPLQRQKTGATWDEGLPPPMRVQRRQWSDNEGASVSTNSSRQDITRVSSGRRSGSLNREEEEERRKKREEGEVHVVESPYEWWK